LQEDGKALALGFSYVEQPESHLEPFNAADTQDTSFDPGRCNGLAERRRRWQRTFDIPVVIRRRESPRRDGSDLEPDQCANGE
jgi:hypothetical protein